MCTLRQLPFPIRALRRALFTLLLIGSALTAVAPASATGPTEQEPVAVPHDRPLIVATKPAPPFVMKSETGEWTGLSIELWNRVAGRLDTRYELREASIPEMIDGLAQGRYDVSAAAMTVTPEREMRIDFIHPFHTTGLAIATRSADRNGWLRSLLAFASVDFLRVILALAALLLVCGLLVWLLERRKNPEMFGGTTPEGIGAGFWWAAVTMTTVGYGDKAPQTVGGRLVALVWMFASLVVISGFTAAIASALTLGGMGAPVQGPDDLDEVRVGTVPRTTSALYLADQGTPHVDVESVPAGLRALRDGRIDALVYDRPILVHLIRENHPGILQVLPVTFERQDYAFAVPQDSPMREAINRTVLELVAGDAASEWKILMNRYLE
jgi:ABC-type amino acid transport substrate-binding protein